MKSALTDRRRSATRRGGVAVMVAVCLTILMAVLALAMDGGRLRDDKRQCKAGAEGAGMAGPLKM